MDKWQKKAELARPARRSMSYLGMDYTAWQSRCTNLAPQNKPHNKPQNNELKKVRENQPELYVGGVLSGSMLASSLRKRANSRRSTAALSSKRTSSSPVASAAAASVFTSSASNRAISSRR